MAGVIINLVNKALEKVGEIPITPAEFDSGIETHMMLARRTIEDILRKMFNLQKEETLKSEFSFNTIPSQAKYVLSFPKTQLITQLRLIMPDLSDTFLIYRAESDALAQYVDFNNLTIEGRPYEWWFETGTIINDIELRLNSIPDDIYTIKGFKYQEYTAVTSLDTTIFSDIGDAVIVNYVSAQLANYYQKANLADLNLQYSESFSTWLLENNNTDNIRLQYLPHQVYNEY